MKLKPEPRRAVAPVGSCGFDMAAGITARPVNSLEKMKQVRSLSRKTITHRKQHCVFVLVDLKCVFLIFTPSEGPCLGAQLQYMCCIIHSSAPRNSEATICVGYHVVILCRHSAYDGSQSVTADVTFPIWAINKYSAAMAALLLTQLLHN